MILEFIFDPFLMGAIVFFVLLIFLLIKKKLNPLEERKKVEKIFKSLGSDYILYKDIVIPAQGGMSYIDYILTSPYGIFVIDFRTETNTIHGNVNAREWRIGKGNTIYNPVWRNRTHMNGLENQVGPLPMESLVVFLHGKLVGNFGPGVVVPNQIESFIKVRDEPRISFEQLQFVKEILGSFQGQENR